MTIKYCICKYLRDNQILINLSFTIHILLLSQFEHYFRFAFQPKMFESIKL